MHIGSSWPLSVICPKGGEPGGCSLGEVEFAAFAISGLSIARVCLECEGKYCIVSF